MVHRLLGAAVFKQTSRSKIRISGMSECDDQASSTSLADVLSGSALQA